MVWISYAGRYCNGRGELKCFLSWRTHHNGASKSCLFGIDPYVISEVGGGGGSSKG